MTSALIAFVSRHGQTERIALRISKVLSDHGMAVDLVDIGRMRTRPPLEHYGLIIVAGAVQFGKHARRFERFIRDNRAVLEDAVLCSVSGAAGDPKSRKEAEGYVTALERRTGWTPRRYLLAGGAIRYTQYGPLLRWMMRRIALTTGGGTDTTRDYEYTNWAEIEEFAYALAVSREAAPEESACNVFSNTTSPP